MSLQYIASLNRKDYENEAKYDALNLKSVKRKPLEIDFKVAKRDNEDKMTNRDDVADISLRDLALDMQLEKISNAAIPDMPRKQNPVVSEVTAEMIADYQEEQRKPLEIDGKFYPYHPIDLNIDTENIPNIPTEISPDRDRLLKEQETRALEQVKIIQAQIELIDKAVYEATQSYDTNITQIQSENEAGYISNEEARDLYRQQLAEYEEFNKIAVLTREQLTRRLENVSRQIYSISDRRYREEEQLSENRAEIARIKQDNQHKLNQAESAFNVLNEGKASIRRLPDETDNEYAIRLEQIGDAPEIDPALLAERADLRNTQKLIANLKTILKPEQASNISKMITADQKFQINKKFPKIKTEYEKTYNKSVKVPEQELIDFFMSVTGFVEKPLPSESQLQEQPQELSKLRERLRSRKPEPPSYAEVVEEPIYAQVEPIRARRGRPAKGEEPPREAPPRELTKQEMIDYLRANHGWDTRFRDIRSSTIKADVKRIYDAIINDPEPEPPRRIQLGGIEFPNPEIGEGIKSKALPKRAHFGKVSINPHKLYHKNILSVRNLKGQAIGIRDIPVSDGMSDMLLKMLDGVNPVKKDFAVLDKHEPALYNNLIHLAQLHKNFETPNLQETKQQMKHRMELLQGEREAGNSAPSILSEAKQLLRLMVGNGMLKSTQARKHYEYLKSCC